MTVRSALTYSARHAITLISLLVLASTAHGQHRVYDSNVRTLQVAVNGDPFLPPVLKLGRLSCLNISWDEMSHNYHRYTYRVQHCTRDWQPSDDLFESDYLHGTNGLPLEDYETSFNTTQLYTHYRLTFPNRDASVLISGNYKLLVMEESEEEGDEEPVIEVRFCVVEEEAKLTMQVASNTDIDFNDKHQQVSLQLNYGSLNVTDPYTQIHAVVMQNRREGRTVSGVRPDVIKGGGLEWAHCRELIFPAGNEYHKFEVLDVNHSGMNVDRMRWFDPYHHAILWENDVPGSYITTEDHDGGFLPRTENREADDTQAEYVIVHFALQSPRLPQYVYVNGWWSNGERDAECLMEYDDETGCYEAAVLLKQGYYDYQYIMADGSTRRTMGDFWQTENEYIIYIYYREPGGRYDRIVGYAQRHTRL